MKNIRKILMMTAAFAATITLAGSVKVSAQDRTIELNEEREFSLQDYEEDVINFTAPQNGGFHIEVVLADTVKNGKSENYGNVTLSAKLVHDYKKSWEAFNINRDKGRIVSPDFCYAPGSNMQLQVKGNFNKYTFKYKVKIVSDGNKFYEKETNDIAKKATSIKLKKTYSGVLNDIEDTDWFVFKAPKAGKYKFYVVNTETSWKPIQATGFKTKKKADTNAISVYPEKGWAKVKAVSLKKGQKYYVKVAKAYNNNATYQIKVKKK